MISGADERIGLVIEATKRTAAVQEVTAEVRQSAQAVVQANEAVRKSATAVRGVHDDVTISVQKQAREMDRATRVILLGRKAVEEAERKAAKAAKESAEGHVSELERERAAIAEGIRLLALKGQLIDAASAESVKGFREEAAALQDAARAAKVKEEAYLRLQLVVQGTERRILTQTAATERAATAAARVGPAMGIPHDKLNKGAMALRDVAFAAEQAKLGGKEAIAAFGNLSSTLALVSQNAKFAAWAGGLGAAVTVAGTLLSVFQQMRAEAAQLAPIFTEHLGRLSGAPGLVTVREQIAAVRTQLEQTRATELAMIELRGKPGNMLNPQFWVTLALAAEAMPSQVARLEKQLQALTEKEGEIRVGLRAEEVERAKEAAAATVERNRTLQTQAERLTSEQREQLRLAQLEAQAAGRRHASLDTTTLLQKVQAGQAFQQRKQEIEDLFTLRDSQGKLVALTAEQLAFKRRLLSTAQQLRDVTFQRIEAERDAAVRDLDRSIQRDRAQLDGIRGAHEERMRQIREEQAAMEAANVPRIGERSSPEDIATEQARVAERRAQIELATEQKIRTARLQTLRTTIGYMGQLTQVMRESGSAQVRAVGNAADAIRRVLIGADGARAAVKAIFAGGEALTALGHGDFAGAATHGAAAAEYGAAAALAAQESLGGGRGARGGGGAGGGGGTVFEPESRAAQGGLTVNLITRDPYGRENIAQTIYEIDRAGVLKRPIPIPPTTGLSRFGSAA